MKFYKLICILLVFKYSCSYSQTCIIVVRTNDSLVVGTDSRQSTFSLVTDRNGKKQYTVRFTTVCKVRHIRDIFFSNAGMGSNEAYFTAEKSAIKYKTLNEVAMHFLVIRKSEIYKYLDSIRANKDLFQKSYQKLKSFETVFYGIENQIPKVILVSFTLTSKVNEPFKLKDSISYYLIDKPNGANFILLGEHSVADSLIRNTIMGKNTLITNVVFMLNKQSEATPGSVAAPFEVFTLTKNNKINWYFNYLNCN
jgi:hypothetical protein